MDLCKGKTTFTIHLVFSLEIILTTKTAIFHQYFMSYWSSVFAKKMYNGEFILADYGLDMQQWLWGEKYESSDEYWHVSQLLIFVCIKKMRRDWDISIWTPPPPPHPESSQNWCSPGSVNGIFMNNINTGQLMEYNEDCTRLLCYQNEVFSSVFLSVPNLLIRTQKKILLH